MKVVKNIRWLVISFIFIVMIRSFVLTSYIVEGHSMTPTLHSGQRVVVSLLTDLFVPIAAGDVVFFKLNEENTFVKRVVAVPGDYINVHHHMLYVNGKKVKIAKSDFGSLLHIKGMDQQIVPEKCYIVLGDHLDESVDSRSFGCVNKAEIIGKVIF